MILSSAIKIDVKGVFNWCEMSDSESFNSNLLDYPTYTKPQEYKGMKVPDVLISGNHEKIAKWRYEQQIERTKSRRPDLLK